MKTLKVLKRAATRKAHWKGFGICKWLVPCAGRRVVTCHFVQQYKVEGCTMLGRGVREGTVLGSQASKGISELSTQTGFIETKV